MEMYFIENESGKEVTQWYGSEGHGDTAECHSEPEPTCGCPETRTCEWSHTVSDADFGYWHESWGDPPLHDFKCDEPGAVVHEQNDWDGTTYEVTLCTKHAGENR